MERTPGETGQLQPDIRVDTISKKGPDQPLPHVCACVCELKKWGRGRTDHIELGHTAPIFTTAQREWSSLGEERL